MINKHILACLISICITAITYLIHTKYNNEEFNKTTLIKLVLLSITVTMSTSCVLNTEAGRIVNSQDVLTGDPGF